MFKLENDRIIISNHILANDEKINDLNNNRVLIVDDNESIHQDLIKILTFDTEPDEFKEEFNSLKRDLFEEDCPDENQQNMVSYEIDSAYQGQEALMKVEKSYEEKRPYALIFMDIRMPPGWDGIETIRKIWDKFPEIEIIICSAYSDYSWKKIVDKLGASDRLLFLQKPFTTVEVQQMTMAKVKKWNLNKLANYKLNNLEISLAERNNYLESLINNIKVALIVTDSQGYITLYNPMFRTFFNIKQEIISKNILDLMDDLPNIKKNLSEIYNLPEPISSFFYGDLEGKIYKFSLLNMESKSSGQELILHIIEDVTEWHKRINTDSMTGLWNQKYLKDQLHKELVRYSRYKTNIAFIMIDVDKFKLINDNYGHPTGDLIIKTIADILKIYGRETDIIGRYGGDEFAMILPLTDEEGAHIFAERLQKKIRELKVYDIFDNLIGNLSLSIGISECSDKETSESFIQKADQALYKAKNSGRNCIIKYSSLS